jgi:hypothetical protein
MEQLPINILILLLINSQSVWLVSGVSPAAGQKIFLTRSTGWTGYNYTKPT